jgi:hypothetical protein
VNAQVQPTERTDGAIGRLWCPSGGVAPCRAPRRLEIDLELKTTFETVARLSAAHRFGQVVVSQKSASEVHN